MYKVSQDYIKTIMGKAVTSGWRGTITTSRGLQYDFTEKDLVSGSTKITREIASDSEFEIGSTCAAELSMGIYLDVDRYVLYGGTVNLIYRLLVGSEWEEIPLGEFNITEPPERSLEIITLHAYDNMIRFNRPCGAQLTGKPFALLQTACNICGVGLGSSQSEIEAMPNGGIETYADEAVEIKTYRDLIGFVATFLCGYAIVDADGLLYIKQYSMTPVRTIGQDWRYKFTPCDYEINYTSLTATLAGVGKEEYTSTGESGLGYDLGENPFIQFPSEDIRRSIYTSILNTLTELTYTPFDLTCPCDPALTVGDVLSFTGGQAVADKLSVITKQTITVNNAMSLSLKGTDPASQVTTDVDKRLDSAIRSSTDDGMHYYDYVNAEAIHIGDGEKAAIIRFNYATGKETHVDFHSEVKFLVNTTEIDSNPDDSEEGIWTEHDGRILVTYYSNGEEIESYYPADWFLDGTHLLHLLWAFWASSNQRGTFEVYLSCEGCSVDIDANNCHAYIAGCGLAGDSAWDGTIQIYEDFEPIEFSCVLGSFTDSVEFRFPGIIRQALQDNIIALDFYETTINKFTDKVNAVKSLFRFDVPYTDNQVGKDGIISENRVWKLADGVTTGTLTTADCQTSRVEKITSLHSGDDVAYLVSFDSGATWWTYSNGWEEPDYTIKLPGMNEATLASIKAAAYAEKLAGSIMVKATLLGSATVTDIQIYTSSASDWTYVATSDFESYDSDYVSRTDAEMKLITNYTVGSEEQAIDSGRMAALAINTAIFSEISEIEVEKDG
ncbi:MAG: hypothetical protein ACI4ET_12770 [Bilifractor sp.]